MVKSINSLKVFRCIQLLLQNTVWVVVSKKLHSHGPILRTAQDNYEDFMGETRYGGKLARVTFVLKSSSRAVPNHDLPLNLQGCALC